MIKTGDKIHKLCKNTTLVYNVKSIVGNNVYLEKDGKTILVQMSKAVRWRNEHFLSMNEKDDGSPF